MDGDKQSAGQMFSCIGRNPAACMDCLNANGEPPWEDSPMKMYCVAFPRADGASKPPDVYYDGADCPMRRTS